MENETYPSDNKLNRRSFLNGAIPTAVLASGMVPTWAAGTPDPVPGSGNLPENNNLPGLIIREKEPLNLEFPFPTLKERLTPNNRFFVRSHFPIPKIDAASWQLSIDGEVRKEIRIGYEELTKLPSRTVTATIECAGNGRAYLVPKSKGLLWEQGGIGTAEWTGVSLSVLLNQAGVKQDAVEIILEGTDEGEITEEPKTPGKIKFARSLSLKKAMQPEVLLAYQMNGKPLSPEHGFPVRVIIPGYYGMASVKWIAKITATAKPYEGYWQTLEYAYWKRQVGLPTLTAVTENLVKSEIARPMLHEVVPAGKPYRVYGAAWTGEGEVVRIELSADEGATWQPASLLEQPIPYTWRLWELNWMAPSAPGNYKLMARAIDKNGNTQPTSHNADKRNYMINHTTVIDISVA